MNESREGSEPELLGATVDQSFGSAVVDAVERTGGAAGAERVEPVTGIPLGVVLKGRSDPANADVFAILMERNQITCSHLLESICPTLGGPEDTD